MNNVRWAAFAIALAGCGETAAPMNERPAAASSWSGQHSSLQLPAARVIDNEADWKAFWSPTEAPQVDFSRSFAVAVSAGSKPTGGYSVEIDDPAESGGQCFINYRIKAPPPDAMVTQAFTQPFAARVFPKSRRACVLKESR